MCGVRNMTQRARVIALDIETISETGVPSLQIFWFPAISLAGDTGNGFCFDYPLSSVEKLSGYKPPFRFFD